MSNDFAIYLSRQLLWSALLISSPVIITALLCGLCVSILQVVTQVQDSSLSVIPKLFSVLLMLMLSGGWMLHQIMDFATQVIGHIPEVLG